MHVDPDTRIAVGFLAGLLALSGATAQPEPVFANLDQPIASRSVDELVESFVATATALPFVRSGGLAHARSLSTPVPAELRNRHRDAMGAAVSLAGYPERLAELLDHEHPRVRLMAGWGLYRTCDPRWLEALGRLSQDRASIACQQHLSGALNYEEVLRWHREHPASATTTVGTEAASWLVGWEAPDAKSLRFAEWCALQRELHPTAACIRAKLRLETRGVSSTSSWDAAALHRVTALAQRAGPIAGEIASIAVMHDKYSALGGGAHSDPERQLENAARRVGRDNLLRMLRGELPQLDGADLPSPRVAGFEEPFLRFALDRAERIGLEPEDAELLLAHARGREGWLVAYRAAARLRPDDALPTLSEALARDRRVVVNRDHVDCALLLYDLQPEQSVELLTKWFHTSVPASQRFWPGHRQRLLVHLLHRFTPHARAFFATLVADPRFERATPAELEWTLRELIVTTHDLPFTRDELTSVLRHPLGADRAFEDLPGARSRHPAETERMLATLADWRTALRAHTAAWR